MSTQVFPSLLGLGWNVKRKALWKTNAQENISGKEVRIAYWSSPRYEWELTFEFLRQGTVNGQAASDFASLLGFFNLRQGMFDSFLFADPDDNATPIDQLIGTGDGSTTLFQLLSTFGGYVQPILAPNVVANVKVNGAVTSAFTLNAWGTSQPGTIAFNTAPGAGQSVTWTGSYYYPCRFVEDELDFEKFMTALWEAKSVKFQSIK